MFIPRLLDIDVQIPSWTMTYGYATMLRTLHYHRTSHFERWMNWAGATSFVHIPPVGNLQSNQVIMKDGRDAIVFFEGTRNPDQVLHEVIEAWATFDATANRYYHNYFLWALREEWDGILGHLQDLPPGGRVLAVGHSLGGAMAQIFCQRARRNNLFPIAGCVTFGQPRTEASAGTEPVPFTYMRFINDTDPIPGVPPRGITTHFLNPIWRTVQPGFDYYHLAPAWVLYPGGASAFRDNTWTNEIYPQIPEWLADPAPWDEVVQQNHIMRIYTDRVRRFVPTDSYTPTLPALHELNREIDALDFTPAGRAPALVGIPSAGVFAHPEVTLPAGRGLPTVPPAAVGTTIEQRKVSHFFFQFGGNDIMAKQFQGRDRRLIRNLWTLLEAVQKRDARVANPKKTRTLSNRILMFPPGGEDQLEACVNQLIHQCEILYDEEK